MMKKAQANIIVVVLLILIVIVAVLIVWNIVNPLVKEKSEGVELSRFTTSLEIKEVAIIGTGIIKVSVKRSAGGGEIDNLRFIFYDENGNSESVDETGINELETKTYNFASFSGLGKIKKVAVVPVIDGNLGMEDEAETSEILEVPLGVANWWKFDDLTGGFVKYYSNENLVFENEMAVSFWVQDDGLMKGDNYEISYENDKVFLFYNSEDFESDNLEADDWNHIVVSVDASAHSKIYINNTLVKTFNVETDLSIKNNNLNVSGNVDDVMLFNRALFETDVNGLYIYQMK